MQFRRAQTMDEALEHLGEWGSEAEILAGGTDVMPQYLRGEITPGALIHIEGITELSSVRQNGRTAIGSLVTHRSVATSPDLARAHPGLVAAAKLVGGWQTQAVGTVGGNVCNASPAADAAAPLLVADAQVTLTSRSGERRMPLSEFFIDRRRTAIEPQELLTEISLEPLPDGAGEAYIKLSRRGAMEVALVGIAVRLGFLADGSVETASVAISSVAPTPRRVPDAESLLIGSKLESEALEAAGVALRSASSAIDDARASASYRTRTLEGLLGRAARQCYEMVTL